MLFCPMKMRFLMKFSSAPRPSQGRCFLAPRAPSSPASANPGTESSDRTDTDCQRTGSALLIRPLGQAGAKWRAPLSRLSARQLRLRDGRKRVAQCRWMMQQGGPAPSRLALCRRALAEVRRKWVINGRPTTLRRSETSLCRPLSGPSDDGAPDPPGRHRRPGSLQKLLAQPWGCCSAAKDVCPRAPPRRSARPPGVAPSAEFEDNRTLHG